MQRHVYLKITPLEKNPLLPNLDEFPDDNFFPSAPPPAKAYHKNRNILGTLFYMHTSPTMKISCKRKTYSSNALSLLYPGVDTFFCTRTHSHIHTPVFKQTPVPSFLVKTRRFVLHFIPCRSHMRRKRKEPFVLPCTRDDGVVPFFSEGGRSIYPRFFFSLLSPSDSLFSPSAFRGRSKISRFVGGRGVASIK